MQTTLEWPCRVIGRLDFDISESLANLMIFSQNIKNKMLFFVTFRKNYINSPIDV